MLNAPRLIDDLIGDFIEDKGSFLAKCKVTPSKIMWLAERTTEQLKSHLLGQYRRLRLTGSDFGEVIKACEQHIKHNSQLPPSLFKRLRGEYALRTKESIMWGQMHEDVAIKAYIEVTGNTVKPARLYLFLCGFLGCSPDGIIEEMSSGEKGALEMKCPTVADIFAA
eukprot:gene10083-18733_t